MSDTEQQSFQAWLKGHFTFDSRDLAEISNLIAVPGLSDVDMPDVLSLLAEDDAPQQPGTLNQLSSPSRNSLDSSRPVGDTTRDLTAAFGQPSTATQQLQGPAPGTQFFDNTMQYQSPFVVQLPRQPEGNPQTQAYSSLATQQHTQQQQPQLQQQSFFQTLNWAQMPLGMPAGQHGQMPLGMPAGQHGDVASGLKCASGTAYDSAPMQLNDLVGPQPGRPVTSAMAAGFDLSSARGSHTAISPAADAATAVESGNWAPGHHRRNSSKFTDSADGAAAQSYSSSQSLSASGTKDSRKAAAPNRATAGRAGATAASRRGAAAAVATASTAVGAAAAEGVVKRRKRKPSEAQRQAHRRFRVRRKEQMSTLEQEVAAKQAQLQALSLEHMALQAKARALDQLVASAGDGMELLHQLEQLSISQKQQQQQQKQQQQEQQLLVEELQDSLSQQQQQQSACEVEQSSQSSAVATSAAVDAAVGPAHKQQQQQPGHSAAAAVKQEPDSVTNAAPANFYLQQQKQKLEQQQAIRMLRWPPSNAFDDACCSTGPVNKQQASNGRYSRANTIGTVDHLEARLKSVLTLPTHDPVQFLPASDRMRVQDELPKLRTLLKSFFGEVMQLMLQIGEETGQSSSSGSSTWMRNTQIGGLLGTVQLPQQQQAGVDLGLLLQQQALRSVPAAAAEAAGDVARSPAYARLQYVLMQATSEFRKFAASNRLSLYHLHTLNLETGTLGVPPPAGHWRKVAQLMKDRLPEQVLSDICVARQLYSNAVVSISHNRRMLFMQLQQLLERYTYMENYNIDSVITELDGPHCEGIAILDAIDKNMRKEYTLEGVFQWTVRKLIPPLLMAEILVHSYPHIADWHSVLTEVVNLSEEVPALTALQELQLQQLHSMQQQQQMGQQQQQRVGGLSQPGIQQAAMPSGYYCDRQQQESAVSGQLQSLDGQQVQLGMSGSCLQQPDLAWQQQMQPDQLWQPQQQQQQQQVQPDLLWQPQQQQQQSGLGWMDQQQPCMAWQLDQQLHTGGTLQGAGLVGIGSLPNAQYLAPAPYY